MWQWDTHSNVSERDSINLTELKLAAANIHMAGGPWLPKKNNSYFPMQISVANVQICWLTAFNICLHLCCRLLQCRMFSWDLISFPFRWPFQTKCSNSIANVHHHYWTAPDHDDDIIVIRTLTWLTQGPFLLTMTMWVRVRVSQLFCGFSQNSLIVRAGSKSLTIHPRVQINRLWPLIGPELTSLTSYWLLASHDNVGT